MLRKFLDDLSSKYRYVIIDNEAGMEHLSRRTTNNVDLLCIIAEPTPIGSVTARRISDLAGQLPIGVKQIGVIWNKVADHPDQIQKAKLNAEDDSLSGIETFGYIPCDTAVFDNSAQGKTVFELAKDNPAYSAIENVLEAILTLSSSS
jgi:CO dehydrogenase maturation factor